MGIRLGLSLCPIKTILYRRGGVVIGLLHGPNTPMRQGALMRVRRSEKRSGNSSNEDMIHMGNLEA